MAKQLNEPLSTTVEACRPYIAVGKINENRYCRPIAAFIKREKCRGR